MNYQPYSLDHVVGQVQLLFLSALAFTLLMRAGIYPPELRSINLDFDWFYRRLAPAIAMAFARAAETVWDASTAAAERGMRQGVVVIERYIGPAGALARAWTTGNMAFWATVMLAAYLVLFYL